MFSPPASRKRALEGCRRRKAICWDCASISAYSRARAAVLLVYMNMLGELLKLGSWFAK